MWDCDNGKNLIRLLDRQNAMGRHYDKLYTIKDRRYEQQYVNVRYEKELTKPKNHSKVKINHAKDLFHQNKKIVNALESISKR